VKPRIGVLALQGDFEAHVKALSEAGASALEVRRCGELPGLDGLVIPGGESTTLLNLMEDEPWFDALRAYHRGGGAIFGTCAGAILLANEVRNPHQPSLGLLDVTVERNGYGRQVDSFVTRVEAAELGGPLEAVFIRAPRFSRVGSGVRILARLNGEPVLVSEGRVVAATFHPELTTDSRVHRFFLGVAARSAASHAAGKSAPVRGTASRNRKKYVGEAAARVLPGGVLRS
jgi:5'-phosphate synthase pdxT subunit